MFYSAYSALKDDFLGRQFTCEKAYYNTFITYTQCHDYGRHAEIDTLVYNVMVDGSGWLSGFFHAVWTTVRENPTKFSAGILYITICQTYVG